MCLYVFRGPGKTSLIDSVSDALLRVVRETATDPQQLSGGERRGQRLCLETHTIHKYMTYTSYTHVNKLVRVPTHLLWGRLSHGDCVRGAIVVLLLPLEH